MKREHDQDPLDQRIDALLASRPLKVSDDFTARVMAATEAEPEERSIMRKILPFALPAAAAIAVALTWPRLQHTSESTDSSAFISTADAQEIFLLEESLAGLASVQNDELAINGLLATLDALYTEI